MPFAGPGAGCEAIDIAGRKGAKAGMGRGHNRIGMQLYHLVDDSC